MSNIMYSLKECSTKNIPYPYRNPVDRFSVMIKLIDYFFNINKRNILSKAKTPKEILLYINNIVCYKKNDICIL